MRAWLYIVPLAIGLAALTVYVVAGDLVRDMLDKADPVAAFADELQADVDAALEVADPRWRDRPDFSRWEREFS